MLVSRFMTQSPVHVSMDDHLSYVKKLFEHYRFHHLLVVENKEVVGVLSDRDLLKVLSPKTESITATEQDLATLKKKVHQAMSRELVTIKADATIYEAISLFNEEHVSCLPVVDELGKPLGILTWRDILKLVQKSFENKAKK